MAETRTQALHRTAGGLGILLPDTIHPGHVHDGYMVNLHADNIKSCELASGAHDADAAEKILEGTGHGLRPALSVVEGNRR